MSSAAVHDVPRDVAVAVRCGGCHHKIGEFSSPFAKKCDRCGTMNRG